MALGSSALSLEIPSRYDQVTDVWVQLERRLHTHFGTAIDEELITVRLAVTEGIVNAIRHAHKEDGRSMKVELVITLSDFMIRIYDTGPGFHWPDATVDLPDFESESGRGVFLIQSAMTEVRYESLGEQNVLILRKDVQVPDAVKAAMANNDRRRRVLIADDDRLIRATVRRMLRKSSTEVVEASNGTEALHHLLNDGAFDAALLDIEMPGLSGLEISNRFRRSTSSGFVPIILLSSRDSSHEVAEGFASGADEYMVKPPRSNELQARLMAAYRLRDMAVALRRTADYLEEQLREARTLQMSMLPSPRMSAIGASFASVFIPCDLVGGDMLGYFPIGKDKIAFYVADVAGHGVSAAMFSMWLHRSLTSAGKEAAEGELSPAFVCSSIDAAMAADESEKYLTMVLGTIDLQTGKIHYCCAGHPPGFIVNENDGVRKLEGSSPPLGMGLGFSFNEFSHSMRAGERLILYSDCAVEVADHCGEQFGEERLVETLQKTHRAELLEQLESVVATLRQHGEGGALNDDLSFVSIEFQGEKNGHQSTTGIR